MSILDKFDDGSLSLQKHVGIRKIPEEQKHDKLKFIFETLLENPGPIATKLCEQAGIMSMYDRPYTEIAIRKNAEQFILKYPEEARELYIEKLNLYDHTDLGEFDWIMFIVSFAVKRIKGKIKFIRWAVNHGFYEDGFPLFKEHYNLSDSDRFAFSKESDD